MNASELLPKSENPGFTLAGIIRKKIAEILDSLGESDKTRTFVRGSVGSLALWGGSLGVRFLLSIVLTRVLGAEAYGHYAYAVAWLAILVVPGILGFDHIALRFIATYREMGSWGLISGFLRCSTQTLAIAAFVLIVVSCLVAVVSPMGAERRITLLITVALLPVVVLAQFRQSVVRAFDRPVLAQIPENLIYPLLLMAFLALLHWKTNSSVSATAAIAANAAAYLAVFALGYILLQRIIPAQVRAAAPVYERQAWFDMVPSLLLTGVGYQLLSKGDLLVLGLLAPAVDVGVYAVASRSAEQFMSVFYSAVSFAGVSVFTGIYAAGDRRELQRFTFLMAKTIFWLSLPVWVVLQAAAPQLLSLFGREFVAGAAPMRVLATGYFLSMMSGFVIIMLYNTGHHRDVAKAMLAAAVLNVGLSFVLIPPLGILGAAIAAAVSLVSLHAGLVVILYHRVSVLSFPFSIPGVKSTT